MSECANLERKYLNGNMIQSLALQVMNSQTVSIFVSLRLQQRSVTAHGNLSVPTSTSTKSADSAFGALHVPQVRTEP